MSVETSQFLLFLVLNAIVFLNAMWLTCLFGGWNTWAERLLDCFLYFIMLVVIGFEVLHFARWITLDGLFAFHIVLAILLGLVARKKGWEIRSFFSLDSIRGLGWGGQVLLCLCVAWFCAYMYYCRYLPPRASDPLGYHLPLPVQWLKDRQLSLVPLYFTASTAAYSPINGELFFAWLIAPFGNDVAVRFGQMPFFAAMMLAMYTVWRRWDLSTTLALGCAAWILVFRPFLLEIVLPNNDLILTAGFLLFVAQWQRFDGGWQSMARCGVGLGLLAGTKVLGLVYLIPCLVLLAGKQFCLRRNLSLRETWRGWALLLVGLVMLGSFRYLQIWSATGNPLYPASLSIGGIGLFPGVLDGHAMSASHHNWRTFFLAWYTEGGFTRFGLTPITATCWVAGVLCSILVWSVGSRGQRKNGDVPWLWLLLVVSYWLVVWTIPVLEKRYLFPVFAVGLLLLGWLVRRAPAWSAGMVAIIVAALFAWESVQIRTVVIYCFSIALLLFLLIWLLMRLKDLGGPLHPKLIPSILFVAVVLVGSLLWGFYVKRYQAVKFQFYAGLWDKHAPGWIWLNEQTRGRDAIVAYTGSAFVYPLFGQDLQNALVYVPVETTPARFLHELNCPPGLRAETTEAFAALSAKLAWDQPDHETWLKRMLEIRPRFLVIYHDPANEPIEASWAGQNPALFENVFAQEQITIYWLRVSEPPSPAS